MGCGLGFGKWEMGGLNMSKVPNKTPNEKRKKKRKKKTKRKKIH